MSLDTACSESKTALEVASDEQSSHKEYPDMLQNRLLFPAFSGLPNEYQKESIVRYYGQDSNGFYSERKTWCFLGTIYNDEFAEIALMRNKVMVIDRDNARMPIYFYPKPGQQFDYSRLKWGRTIAVLYSRMHVFRIVQHEAQIGLRVEDLSTITVLNCTLDQLQALSAHYWSHKEKEKCWACGAIKPLKELQRCGKCVVAKYCCKECQTMDWMVRHKLWCRVMPDFLKLTGFDYNVYKETQHF